MQSSVLRYYLKGVLSNRNLWFWGVAFSFFWLLLGAFEFSTGLSAVRNVVITYTATWYGLIALYSLSALAISVAYSIYYASYSLAYSFRFTKLTPLSYIEALVASSAVLGLILSAILLIASYELFGSRFDINVAPSNPAGAVLLSALAGVFMMSLAMLLVLIAVNYIGLKSINFVSFIPLLLSFGLGEAQIYSSLPIAAVYASPFNCIQSLLYFAYSGNAIPLKFTEPSAGTLYWPYMLISLIGWIIILLFVDSLLLRSIRPRQIEEGRQV